MKFTLSSDFKCNGHQFNQGNAIELLPTSSSRLIMKANGHEFDVGPIIFNFLNEVEHPSLDVLMKWSQSLICESPTGHLVEVHGTGPDGFHSWFRYLDYI